jgi:hypothetical protein
MPIPLQGKLVRLLRSKTFNLKGGATYQVSPEDNAICVSEPKTFAEANLRDLGDQDGVSKFWYRIFVHKDQGPKSPGFVVDVQAFDLGIYDPVTKEVIPVIA